MPERNLTLREITGDNVREVMRLSVSDAQDSYVAPNSWTIGEAAYADEIWLRAVYADDTPVGLVLLSERRELPRYYLWRFMIDQNHQRKGYGKWAMEGLIEYVKTLPSGSDLYLSFVPGDDGPELFYRSLGFVTTGREDGGELEMVLVLCAEQAFSSYKDLR